MAYTASASVEDTVSVTSPPSAPTSSAEAVTSGTGLIATPSMTTFPRISLAAVLPGRLPVFTRIPAILNPVSCALATSWALTVADNTAVWPPPQNRAVMGMTYCPSTNNSHLFST